MAIRIALAGNPNSGKTTLFNSLTGSNQYVGNWPGVTVEKKEGKLKNHEKDVIITDLPGIYSLSPYTLEEVVSRNYLLGEKPEAIINIIDGTNLERNLYLTTQLLELGIPMVIALNMMDLVRKSGDELKTKELEKKLGVPVIEISALKGEHVLEAAEKAIEVAQKNMIPTPLKFSQNIEDTLLLIEDEACQDIKENQKKWFAIKYFERDEKIVSSYPLNNDVKDKVEEQIKKVEEQEDDDAESIITAERYSLVSSVIKDSYKRKNKDKLSTSDKIDKVVTNRWAALPIFALVIFLIYYISVSTLGAWLTDWTNDNLFGDGFHLLGIGMTSYADAADEYGDIAQEQEGFQTQAMDKGYAELQENADGEEEFVWIDDSEDAKAFVAKVILIDEETGEELETVEISYTDYYNEVLDLESIKEQDGATLATVTEPDPADYGVWVPGIPALIESGLDAMHTADWLKSLILDGIVAGVGAVLGFVPQMLVLFLLLAFLEGCGYMARIAFILDRIFRRFGLSGKSFIPMLIGTGCGVPGVMASRTIENEPDRRMTIMTTTFIPCGAKLPVIALIAGAMFGGVWWVAPSAYFLGVGSIIVSGLMLKKTKPFAGDPAPFVMELPAYHMPRFSDMLRSMWERGWSFIKRAFTLILLTTILLWFMESFNWKFQMVESMDESILASIGHALAWLFAPLGWGFWQPTVAAVTGLLAKETVVGTFGTLYSGAEVAESGWQIWTALQADFAAHSFGTGALAGYSFLAFNLLCAPCFAAIGAIKREMNNAKWTWAAVGYQCGWAYVVSLIIYQIGAAFSGHINVIGFIVALLLLAGIIYMIARPYKPKEKLEKKTA